MTPEQAIKYMVLDIFDAKTPTDLTGEVVDELYDAVNPDDRQDILYSVRGGNFETDIECGWSRHYESKSVAAKAPNGLWVGWTYWYGGGKHSEPEAISWMDSAYFIDCKEEEQLVTVRTFTKQSM